MRAERWETGAALVLPTGTPYERELVAEHLHGVARRRGAVRVRLAEQDWVLVWRPQDCASRCAACGGRQRGLRVRLSARDCCARCALDSAVTHSARGTCCAVIAPLRTLRAASA
jgi:transposase InsO family protein